MVGIEHSNVTNEELMEEVEQYECVYNRNSKDLPEYFSNPKPMFPSV